MRTFLASALVLLASTGAGCDASSPAAVEVRVVNATGADFDDVAVGFDDPPVSYGPVADGAASAYRAFGVAYSYGYVRAETEAGELVLQPIDFVGEAPLAPGRYTFRLGAEEGRLTLGLVAD